jgi:hypothetical protein
MFGVFDLEKDRQASNCPWRLTQLAANNERLLLRVTTTSLRKLSLPPQADKTQAVLPQDLDCLRAFRAKKINNRWFICVSPSLTKSNGKCLDRHSDMKLFITDHAP